MSYISNGLIVQLDASNTASMTLDGSNYITQWLDQSGSGNHFKTGPTNATPHYDSTLFSNHGGAFFSQSASSTMEMINNMQIPLNTSQMTVTLVMRRITSEQGPLLSDEYNNVNLVWFPDLSCQGYNAGTPGLSPYRMPLNQDIVYTTTLDSGLSRHFIYGMPEGRITTGQVGPTTFPLSQKLELGGNTAHQGGCADFKAGLILIHNRVLSDEEIVALQSYAAEKWNVASARSSYNIVADGNSLTEAIGIGELTWLTKVPEDLSISQNNFIKVASGGKDLVTALYQAPVIVDPLFDKSRLSKHNICFIWEITNELNKSTATQASVEALLVQYCKDRRSAGFKVIVGTCLPRTTSKTNFETDRLAINTYIQNNYTNWADALADIGSDATIGATGANTNTTLYIDGIHLSVTGHSYVCPIVETAINAILAL